MLGISPLPDTDIKMIDETHAFDINYRAVGHDIDV